MIILTVLKGGIIQKRDPFSHSICTNQHPDGAHPASTSSPGPRRWHQGDRISAQVRPPETIHYLPILLHAPAPPVTTCNYLLLSVTTCNFSSTFLCYSRLQYYSVILPVTISDLPPLLQAPALPEDLELQPHRHPGGSGEPSLCTPSLLSCSTSSHTPP